MKRNSLFKVFCCAITVLLLSLIIAPLSGRAATVWSDDFNDGNYDGWTIPENSRVYDGDYGWNGSDWTAANQYLQLDQREFGIISHPSNVAYGTWSFDFRINETLSAHGVMGNFAFISNNIHDLDNITEGSWYFIHFEDPTGVSFYISLRKYTNDVLTEYTNTTPIPVAGWHHIDVTRNTTGWFSVYHDYSLIIQELDTQIDTSEMFVLWVERGLMIDNIVVDNEVIPITPPQPVDWLPIGIGVSAVVIVLVLVIFLKRR
ncbi:MAG: hypothetical protein ACW977_13265 [Candidatus Thorarchaeota archaeon]